MVRIYANLPVSCEWNPVLSGYPQQHFQAVPLGIQFECWLSIIPPGLHSAVFLLKPHFSGIRKALDRSAWCGYRVEPEPARTALRAAMDCLVTTQGWCDIYCSFSSPPDGWIWRERFRWFHPKRSAEEPMAMLPTLPSAQRMADLLGNRAKRFLNLIPHYSSCSYMGTFCEIAKGSHIAFLFNCSWWHCRSAPMPSTLPYENEAKEMMWHPLILPFFPTTFLVQFSAPYFSLLAAHTSAVWSWPALPKLYQIGRSFSFQIRGTPMTFFKTKEGSRYDPAHHRKCPVWAFKS